MGLKLMLPEVRGSFLVLGEPEQYQGAGPFRWSSTALIPYDSALLQRSATPSRKRRNRSGKRSGRSTTKPASPIRRHAASWTASARTTTATRATSPSRRTATKTKGRPLVMDTDKSPIYKPNNEVYEGKGGRLYSGCFINMQVEFWAQDNKTGKGLRATLLGVQRVRDGDAFGGGAAPSADDFGEIADGADADDLA